MTNFNFRIGGPAGSGVLNAGLNMFAKTCLRNGLNVFTCAEYPSLIRGGHNYLTVSISDEKIYSHHKNIDLLIALDQKTIDKHKNISKTIIHDSSLNGNGIALPLKEIAEKNGSTLYMNTVAIGAALKLIGLPIEQLNTIINEKFSKKGEDVVNANIQAAKAGYDSVTQEKLTNFLPAQSKKILLNGNEAIVAGAIKAGCKFISAYPMTPATSVLTGMAAESRNYNIVVKHTEDEIASINMAIGAGFTGVRAMTCTSGGGFALMAEGLGLAAQTETPLVIVESQRPGPGSGMATRTSQGDLNFILNASTDEFPRVIIAPGDVNECFYLTQKAFNLAEKYQTPVIILVDKFLSTSNSSIEPFDKLIPINRGKVVITTDGNYKRYSITPDGISPRVLPGLANAEHVASSYEHNENGTEDESPKNRIAMHDKRFRKFETMARELKQPKVIGKSDNIIISWGSTKGIVREAHKLLKNFSHLHLPILSPFPKQTLEKIKDKNLIVVENNKTSQLSDLIAKETGIIIQKKILKYDGRQFNPEDLAKELKEVLI
jgi:2-oxoglutarate/2-oxoacid ferredoxin oxidoreductase subunit alpha